MSPHEGAEEAVDSSSISRDIGEATGSTIAP